MVTIVLLPSTTVAFPSSETPPLDYADIKETCRKIEGCIPSGRNITAQASSLQLVTDTFAPTSGLRIVQHLYGQLSNWYEILGNGQTG